MAACGPFGPGYDSAFRVSPGAKPCPAFAGNALFGSLMQGDEALSDLLEMQAHGG